MLYFILSLYVNPAHSNERIPISICPLVGGVGLRDICCFGWNTSAFVDTAYP